MVFFLIILLVVAVQLFFEWWLMAVVCYFVSAILGKTAWGVFFSAFFAVFFVWATKAFWADLQNEQILSGRIAELFGLSAGSEWLFAIVAVIGGVIAAFAAISGYYTKRIFIKSKPTSIISR